MPGPVVSEADNWLLNLVRGFLLPSSRHDQRATHRGRNGPTVSPPGCKTPEGRLLRVKGAVMRKAKFSETQIVAILKDAESGVPAADLLRKHGVSRAVTWCSGGD